MRPIRQRERVEFLPYLQAFPLLVLNPVLFLGPLLAAIIDQIISSAFPGGDPTGISGGWSGFFIFLLDSFGLAVAIIVADAIWRRGRASFDEAWEDAKRKAGDIVMTAVGINLVVYVMALLGGQVDAVVSLILELVAWIFVIYALPASAIGGIPGAAALQASLDLVRSRPINAVILSLVSLLAYHYIGGVLPLLIGSLLPATFVDSGNTVLLVIGALLKAIALGYIALIMAQRYNDIAFRR